MEHGTGAKAEITGYCIDGKTGTAAKSRQGSYASASVAAAFPMAVIVVVDEPEGHKKFGYATGGWTDAPAVGRIVARDCPCGPTGKQIQENHTFTSIMAEK